MRDAQNGNAVKQERKRGAEPCQDTEGIGNEAFYIELIEKSPKTSSERTDDDRNRRKTTMKEMKVKADPDQRSPWHDADQRQNL